MKTYFLAGRSLRTALLYLLAIIISQVQAQNPPHSEVRAASTHPTQRSGCFVHLWDGKNFTDSNIVIQSPGKFKNLSQLPGAKVKDWEDEADSLKVGSTATVKAWKEKDFKGTFETFKPGSSHPKISEEPSSLEISCQ